MAIKVLPDRFLEKVELTGSCWLWKAALSQDGYGTFWWDGRTRPAHRFAWSFYNGDIPNGMVICHKCDVPSCINPDHLFLGTVQDNHADMVQKKRIASGEKSGMAKLSSFQILEIREKFRNRTHSYLDLSKEYKVTKENVASIVKYKTWRNIV